VSAANLVIDEGQTVLVQSGEEIIDLLKGGQGVLNIVAIAPVVSELEAAIHELDRAADRDAKPVAERPAPARRPGRSATGS
jgi:hypothetical protein